MTIRELLTSRLEGMILELERAVITDRKLPLHNLDVTLTWTNINEDETAERVEVKLECYEAAGGRWFVEEQTVEAETGNVGDGRF